MPVTITGAKYSGTTVSVVGTTTLTTAASSFVSGDFDAPRMAFLHDSTGDFKGFAHVRRYVATNQLELEREFWDPETKTFVTQVIGDEVYIGQNTSEIAAVGLSVTSSRATVTDDLIWGTAGDDTSVHYYDESIDWLFSDTGAADDYNEFRGGCIVMGHLEDPEQGVVYGGCTWSLDCNDATAVLGVATSSDVCVFVMHGGRIAAVNPNATFSAFGCWSNRLTEREYRLFALIKTEVFGIDLLSIGVGGSFSEPNRHIIDQCFFASTITNSVLVRWGNGINEGSSYKIPLNSSAPISIYGADNSGTFDIGAPADGRSIVSDIGNNNTLWRSNSTPSQTINVTNITSSDYRAGRTTNPGGSPNNNADLFIRFRNTYTNLQTGTTGAILRDSDFSAEDSGVSVADELELQLLLQEVTGHSAGSKRGPYTARIRRYGYDEIEAAVVESTVTLGGGATGPDVVFGGFTNQIARPSLDIAETTALAYSGITITDHGASPVSWSGKDWSITVEVNSGSGRTAKEVWSQIKAGIAQNTSYNGKSGYLWHVLLDESGSSYETARGNSGGAGATLKGVRVVDESDNPFPGIERMQADDGTYYVPPSTVSVQVTVVDSVGSPIENARVYCEAGAGGPAVQGTVILNGITNASGVVLDAGYSYAGDQPLQNGRVRKASSAPLFKNATFAGSIASSGFTATVTMVSDE